MNEYLQISHKMLASKQANKLYKLISYGRMRPHDDSPCRVGAQALAWQGLFGFRSIGTDESLTRQINCL